MSPHDFPELYQARTSLSGAKESILDEWVKEEKCASILHRHEIDPQWFKEYYASNVFDYFMGVVAGQVEMGQCPVMEEFIEYLKNQDIRSDELFTLCTHFKRSTINATYRLGLNSQELFESISYLFDMNFAGVLSLYTDTIYQKEQEAIAAGRAKEYFLSNMSHEIRTPLNAILGFVSLLKGDNLSARHEHYLDIIANSGENLLNIINDILDFSKLRSGEFIIDPQPFNIHTEIANTLELFVPSANLKNLTITSFIDPMLPYQMIADALRIKQIIGNFLSNAIKFSPPNQSIHVEATMINQKLSISVRDYGAGIAPEDQLRIFDAFSQAGEGARHGAGGSGLGLSICKQLAEHMEGEITLISAPNEGSRFCLHVPVEMDIQTERDLLDIERFQKMKFALLSYEESEGYKVDSLRRYWESFGMQFKDVEQLLPVDYDVLIALESSIDDTMIKMIKELRIPFIIITDYLDGYYDEVESITPISFPIYCSKIQEAIYAVLGIGKDNHYGGSNSVRRHFNGKVLVAEDNEANQELMKMTLERYGLECVIVPNGQEAYEKAVSESFDLIFMDKHMPVMNGYEATEKIRAYEAQHAQSARPIVALTANVMKGSRERALRHGYSDFVGKPIVMSEIESVLERYTREVCRLKADEEKDDSSEESEQITRLQTILMLDAAQIHQLLNLFHQKIAGAFEKLKEAIEDNDRDQIGLVAHSIKGSSANFRFEEMTRLAALIESSSAEEEEGFDFKEAYKALLEEYGKVYSSR